MAYVETERLLQFAQTPDSHDAAVFDQLALAGSRAFDREVQVADGFFDKSGATATAKTIRTNGEFLLKLPPFVVGSLTTLAAEMGFTFPAYTLVDREAGRQYLSVDKSKFQASLGVGAGFGGGSYNGITDYVSTRDYQFSNYANYPVSGFTNISFNLTVTAKWGFADVPADVAQAVIEWALTTWRQRTDPTFTVISGDNGTDKTMPGFRETAKRYREIYSDKVLFG